MKVIVKTTFDPKKIDIGTVNQVWLYNSSQLLIKMARENAPYDTGTLKKSIGCEPGNITKKTKSITIWPRKVVYAVRREFENYKNPDRKFYMKRTFDKAEKIVQDCFEKAVAMVIAKL